MFFKSEALRGAIFEGPRDFTTGIADEGGAISDEAKPDPIIALLKTPAMNAADRSRQMN
jgi:hypothetical protein